MKTPRKFIIALATAWLLQAFPAAGQTDLTFHAMTGVPQRNFLNPAFIPTGTTVVGLPVLSGFHTQLFAPFSYSDIVEKGPGDSLTLRPDKLFSRLTKESKIRTFAQVDILTVGTPIARNRFYLMLSIRERMYQQTALPTDLGKMVWYGNASPQVFGRPVNIAPSVSLLAFDEYSAALSGYALGDRITWGARIKYLAGRFNITPVKSEFIVSTDPETYRLDMQSDFEYRTSGIDGIDEYFDQPASNLVFPGNHGAGIDLGLTFRINDRIRVNASVLDIGFIRWRKNTLEMKSEHPGQPFAFKGVTIQGFLAMVDTLDNFGLNLRDSIFDIVGIDSIYGRAYTDWLPVRYHAGGNFDLDARNAFGLLLGGTSWKGHFQPALSLSYHYSIPRILGVVVSYNITNRQYTQVGLGFNVNAGPVQLYAVTDNVPGLISYRSNRSYGFRFGLNIAVRSRQEGKQPASAPEESSPGAVE